MRKLIQNINELFDSKPTKPTTETPEGHLKTGHIQYMSMPSSEHKSKYSPDYSGKTHDVGWDTTKKDGSKSENTEMLHDALHTHRHFVQNKTNVGDIVRNIPTKSDDGKDKRARIYKKAAGFGSAETENDSSAGINQRMQHGIVKQHPDNHENEELRGKKYLHPLHHTDIQAHENPAKPEPRIIRWK